MPNGVSIFVSVNSSAAPLALPNPLTGTAATLTSSETGAFSPVTATTTTVSAVSSRFRWSTAPASAVWEVTAANPLVTQTYSFGYFAVATASPATNSPAVGTGTVNLSYAPVPPAFTAAAGAVASATLPIPRFIDTSTATERNFRHDMSYEPVVSVRD